MLDALKALFENNAISEEIRAEIEQAWDQKIKENRLSATAELREEFAQRFEHDKQQIVEAMDKFITDSLKDELAELAEDKKATVAERVNYKKAVSEHAVL